MAERLSPHDPTHSHPEKLDSTRAQSWALPSLGSKQKVIQSAIKERQQKKPSIEIIEDVPRNKTPKNLTAQELVAISETAEKEGFELGHKEGLTLGKTEGYNIGFDEGSKKAYQETYQNVEQERARLKAITDELMQPMLNQQQEIETIVIDIAVNLAKRLIQSEITLHPEKLFYVVKNAIGSLPVGVKNIRVFLKESDKKLLESLSDTTPDIQQWSLEVDNSLTSGGCRIETQESALNCDVQAKIDEYFHDTATQPDIEPQPYIDRPEEAAIDACSLANSHSDLSGTLVVDEPIGEEDGDDIRAKVDNNKRTPQAVETETENVKKSVDTVATQKVRPDE